MQEEPYFYQPLENIEDIAEFESAVERSRLTKNLSSGRPYTYWTLELYDVKNGIRGGGGLGVLAADTRRVAEELAVPFALITPFYPSEAHQIMRDGQLIDEHRAVNYADYGFRKIDTVNVHCCGNLCTLEVIEKRFRYTRIICITEPNFGELYSGTSGSDHRLYQEVSLGFGGYKALKLLGLRPAVIQLNEVATFFGALARLDELVANGMDFYEAVVYTRKHTLYTNHTLVQAAEAEFSREQFERFVYQNLRSKSVREWLDDKFEQDKIRLSSVTIEIAEMRSGVSKLHARVANYRDLAGNKVKFKAITNGIDMNTWVMPEVMEFYRKSGVLGADTAPSADYAERLESLTADRIRSLKRVGRNILNDTLMRRPDQNGEIVHFGENELVFVFKRRFVDYKRPDLPFRNPERLKQILERFDAHYILAGRVHAGDERMMHKLARILDLVQSDEVLRRRVHYFADYDERLAYALSAGSNVAINVPIVGLEACGTSWEKDVANLNLLVSTHDGGVADAPRESYLCVDGANENDEIEALYRRMEEAGGAWNNDFDLEYLTKKQLSAFLPVISGARMVREYLDYLFPDANSR